MHIHFIGIGGIGVSALAKYYILKGNTISGSDGVESEITKAIEKLGAKVFIGEHKAKNIPENTELVIYSPAVNQDNPEYVRAGELNIRLLSYPQALGQLTKTHYTVAVSGTHGKSTTSSMIGLMLTTAGLDPTVIVGTKLKEFDNSNCRVGKGEFEGKPLLVIEADEHFASFLNYTPDIIVLTSLEADHLDFYDDLDHLKETFKKYVSQLKEGGSLVVNKDDKNLIDIIKDSDNVVWYSLLQKEAASIKEVMQIPGDHNVSNALSALEVGRLLKVPDEKIIRGLSVFQGTWRRFEVIAMQNYTLVSDYAHHPTEIKVTIEGAREKWPDEKIILVFQPHQYQRTKALYDDFVNVLSKIHVNTLIIPDIYDVPGREDTGTGVSGKTLSEDIKEKTSNMEVLHIPDMKDIPAYLTKTIQGGEIVIIMGAGSIYNLTLELTGKLR
ncbi:MAG: UDP-N-acetylmuramate--L-alanine ligase [Patescibacteria group bacterium]|nr:UDP-N-acetylmuramate--L-alanine ligase [Patescibacteria group bacterium]